MQKLAVMTLVSSPAWDTLAGITAPSQKAYADRVGAKFVVLGAGPYPHRHYDKWQIHGLLTRFDRIIYLDADVLLRPNCPDLFASVPAH